MIVEDEPALRRLMTMALEQAGYRVVQAANGEEATQLFDRVGAEIDLLITDVQMPLVDGAELIERLKARRRTLKTMCISATRRIPKTTNGFIPKPFSRQAFLDGIAALLHSR